MNQRTVKKHDQAIAKHYTEHGVGRTIKQRLAYWESTVDGYSISHNPTDKQKVGVFETIWLMDKYPKDFVFC